MLKRLAFAVLVALVISTTSSSGLAAGPTVIGGRVGRAENGIAFLRRLPNGTVQIMVRMTGLPPNTVHAWQIRYGDISCNQPSTEAVTFGAPLADELRANSRGLAFVAADAPAIPQQAVFGSSAYLIRVFEHSLAANPNDLGTSLACSVIGDVPAPDNSKHWW